MTDRSTEVTGRYDDDPDDEVTGRYDDDPGPEVTGRSDDDPDDEVPLFSDDRTDGASAVGALAADPGHDRPPFPEVRPDGASAVGAPAAADRDQARPVDVSREPVPQVTAPPAPWDEAQDPYDDTVWEPIPSRRLPGVPMAFIVLLVIFGIAAFAAWRGYRWFDEQLDPPGEPGAEVLIELGDGDTASNIADDLEEAGVIPNASFYSWYVRLKGGPSFQAGDYVFHENSAAWEVLDTLEAGPAAVAQAVTFPVSVPEGFTVDEIVSAVDAADLPYSGVAFEQALRIEPLPSRWAPTTPPTGEVEQWEGFLFPDTYEVQAGEDPSLLIDRMLRRFDTIAGEVGLEQSVELVGLTPYEVLVVASLIEEEAAIPEDRAKISRVIHNRLDQGIPLGIDATFVYATGTRQLTNEELSIDSPFNTRDRLGLPPTPIAAPGEASLAAALNPEEGPWIYYVRTDEGGVEGAHTFAETEAEFQAAKQICTDLGYCG